MVMMAVVDERNEGPVSKVVLVVRKCQGMIDSRDEVRQANSIQLHFEMKIDRILLSFLQTVQ